MDQLSIDLEPKEEPMQELEVNEENSRIHYCPICSSTNKLRTIEYREDKVFIAVAYLIKEDFNTEEARSFIFEPQNRKICLFHVSKAIKIIYSTLGIRLFDQIDFCPEKSVATVVSVIREFLPGFNDFRGLFKEFVRSFTGKSNLKRKRSVLMEENENGSGDLLRGGYKYLSVGEALKEHEEQATLGFQKFLKDIHEDSISEDEEVEEEHGIKPEVKEEPMEPQITPESSLDMTQTDRCPFCPSLDLKIIPYKEDKTFIAAAYLLTKQITLQEAKQFIGGRRNVCLFHIYIAIKNVYESMGIEPFSPISSIESCESVLSVFRMFWPIYEKEDFVALLTRFVKCFNRCVAKPLRVKRWRPIVCIDCSSSKSEIRTNKTHDVKLVLLVGLLLMKRKTVEEARKLLNEKGNFSACRIHFSEASQHILSCLGVSDNRNLNGIPLEKVEELMSVVNSICPRRRWNAFSLQFCKFYNQFCLSDEL